ncbi:HEXXH motif-containing putative peptide modification protein [Kitasatospora sp. MBT63]|uniref:aKG-HExxH-type peptide beta-hydroxylase n=1 Tax=Kitasatospora sp. MBT63 TaxID=1444768 RepID=UPI00053AAAE0|nr:HEXXH motif-containing putative peptide modification protein [Kitasatospora sp. MBT63]
MKAIPADLAEQVCSADIDVTATARIAAIYHRSLARRAVGRLGEAQRPEAQNLVPRVRRLAPAVVHSLYRNTAGAGPAETRRQLQEAGSPAPAAVYTGPPDAPWLRDGLQEVLRSLGWGDEQVGTVVTALPPEAWSSLYLSRQALRTAWPEAWSEHNTLVEHLVLVRGPMRSATLQSTFGAIYAQVQETGDPLRMFELLLHESAHHALLLREQFTRFIANPDAVGTHALRPDPRPLRGVLHAAFVMWRITEGLHRYQRTHRGGGPLDGHPVEERRIFALQSLHSALALLDESAQWTEDGRILRTALRTSAKHEGIPV